MATLVDPEPVQRMGQIRAQMPAPETEFLTRATDVHADLAYGNSAIVSKPLPFIVRALESLSINDVLASNKGGMQQTPPAKVPGQRPRWMKKKPVLVGLAILLAAAGGLVIVLAAKWPFTRDAMIKRLERASSARVEIRSFRSTYFPPGCVASDVIFHAAPPRSKPDSDSTPLISIKNLVIESSYRGLFSSPKRIQKIIADGLHIHVPAGGANLHSRGRADDSSLVIQAFHVQNAAVEVDGDEWGKKPLSFLIREALFRDLASGRSVPFTVALRNPLPPADLQVQGWIGPWRDNKGNVRSTPVSGSCLLQHGDLSVFKNLGGKLSSQVNFSGTLAKLQLSGETQSPDFEVKESGHRMPLSTRFRGTVDLISGDVALPSLQASLGNTHLHAVAEITGFPKRVKLDVKQGEGQVQDLILLFSNAPRPAITGPIRFQTSIVLPPEKRPFKQRVRLTGNFDIGPARFTAPATRAHVDQLSERARGEKDKNGAQDQEVMSHLRGRVSLEDGVSHFSNVAFFVPGATAMMHGTYNLMNKRVNFDGTMRMQAEVSQATKGVKSFFLKLLDPFFKKKNAGAEVPVSMQGTYGHTHFSARLK